MKTFKISLDEPCSECSGKGGTGEKTCPTCSGRGRVVSQQRTMFGVFQTETVCPDCHGRGVTYANTCTHCHGKGILEKVKEIEKLLKVDESKTTALNCEDIYIQIYGINVKEQRDLRF